MKKWTTLLLVALAAGAAAGVVGALATESYLDQYARELSSGSTPPRLGDERPRTSPGSYEDALARTRERLAPSVVGWFRVLPETASVARGSYDASASLGSGMVISSDGWVLTSQEVFRVSQASQMVAVIGVGVYRVLEAKEDPVTDALLVKLDAANLPVVSFGDDTVLGAGDRVFALSSRSRLLAGSITAVSGSGILTTSETLDARFELDLPGEDVPGAPVANVYGDAVGYMGTDGAMRPLSLSRSVIGRVLKGGEAARPRLGLSVAMLDQAVGHALYGVGALVLERPLFGTPARDAEIEADDVILRAGGRDVGGSDTLARILLDYDPGDTVTLTIKRAEETFDVDVVLDAVE